MKDSIREMIDSLGPYTLGCNVGSLTGLTELSPSEYGALPKDFPGERIFKAPGVHFSGCDWDIAVGSVGGTIYKIQAQIMFEDDGESRKTFQTTYAYCEQELGQPTRHKDTMTIWTTDEGNVVLGYFGEGTPFRAVNLALTSATVVADHLSKGHQEAEATSQDTQGYNFEAFPAAFNEERLAKSEWTGLQRRTIGMGTNRTVEMSLRRYRGVWVWVVFLLVAAALAGLFGRPATGMIV